MRPSNPPYLGAAYYPEDWPLEQIDADVALMKDAGMKVMRVGEFAWSRMEPEEGRYDFDWLHTVVEKLGAAGISVIMCTPTCTPPIWPGRWPAQWNRDRWMTVRVAGWPPMITALP